MTDKHLLAPFSHCPRCGSPEFHTNDDRSKRCGNCGFVYYLNASAAVAAVIVNGRGELLAVTRANEPARGTLDLPGGFVDPGETLEQGVCREVLEETGCHVTSAKYLFSLTNRYLFSGFEVPTTDAFFLCTVSDESEARAADDAATLCRIPLDQVRPELFGLDSISRGVTKFLKQHNAE